MTAPAQTYLLTLTVEDFRLLTRAIMVQSNNVGKLQSLSQSVTSWLVHWQDGTIAIPSGFPPERCLSAGTERRIYVGLAQNTTTVLKAWRECIRHNIDKTATVPVAIVLLAKAFLEMSGEETA